MLKHISKRRLFFLGLLHRWYLFVYFCVYVAISLSDFLWFTILPQLTTVRMEPAGRSWSAQEDSSLLLHGHCTNTLAQSAPWWGKGQFQKHTVLPTSARQCSSLMPAPVSQPWPQQPCFPGKVNRLQAGLLPRAVPCFAWLPPLCPDTALSIGKLWKIIWIWLILKVFFPPSRLSAEIPAHVFMSFWWIWMGD